MKRFALIAGLALLAVGVAGVVWLKPRFEAAMGKFDQAKVDKAKLDILAIEQAVQKYRIANGGDWPKSLDKLAEGAPPLIENDQLRDPWGRPYQFKIEGAGEQERLVVWSRGVDPSDANSFIYSPRGQP